MIFRALILLLLTACASTKPTPYQKEKDKEGYRDTSLDEFRVVSFRGNSYTKKERAQLFAQFRAIENCRNSEQGFANIIDVFDKTIEKEITRSSGSTWGPSYYGMYPFYSRHSSFGLSAGFNTVSGDSWRETVIYPVFEVIYNCAPTIFRPQIVFKEISAEQMSLLVKDLKGAIQVQKILDTSPNKKFLETGDIILKVNGKRIEKVYELIGLISQENKTVQISLMREGVKINSKLTSVDITDEVKQNEEKIVKDVCKLVKEKKQKELKKKTLCSKN
jgi:hypothetical protein